MSFDDEKSRYLDRLRRPDKSTKGSVDDEIKRIIETINAHPDYYTTSSCSGRILLIEVESKASRKKDACWQYVTHQHANPELLKKSLNVIPAPRTVWFVQEPLILHLCARTPDAAQAIIDRAIACGLKRSGMFRTKRRIMIEIMGCDRIESPVVADGKLLIDDACLAVLVRLANEQMDKKERINEAFLKELKYLVTESQKNNQ